MTESVVDRNLKFSWRTRGGEFETTLAIAAALSEESPGVGRIRATQFCRCIHHRRAIGIGDEARDNLTIHRRYHANSMRQR